MGCSFRGGAYACIYGLTQAIPGCPIAKTTQLPTGGWGTIALVDACDYPNAETALNTFSAKFGLPACTTANGCFSKIHPGASVPTCQDWITEESLDIEWAHAMAPNAKIVLVEAQSASDDDLYAAEDLASETVAANGGGEISNSFGEPETPDEKNTDVHFQTPGIVYFASAADSGAPAKFPSSSPYVVSAGGTSIQRSNGMFTGETAWNLTPSGSGGSGGPSKYESRPAYQNSIARIVGTQRGTPDIAFDADPETGVDVYVIDPGKGVVGWIVDGGTSVSSPALAGIVNSANSRAMSTADEQAIIYGGAAKNYHSYWHDILIGNNGYPCMVGYDFATGLGSVLSYNGK